jgi:hypothetical protein
VNLSPASTGAGTHEREEIRVGFAAFFFATVSTKSFATPL